MENKEETIKEINMSEENIPVPVVVEEKDPETLAMEKRVELTAKLVKPHTKQSRTVTEQDLDRVKTDGEIMWQICYMGNGVYTSAFAVAHTQVDDKDPLAFYIDANGKFFINPVITNHSNYTVEKKEGCLSFPEEPEIMVKRWHKCEYDYQTLSWEGDGDNKKIILSPVFHELLTGREAEVVQHEVDHLNGKYIYPIKES